MVNDNIEQLLGKTAIVCDQMTQFGGADREMFSMLKLLPNSDIYTILFNKKAYPNFKHKVHTSFVQKFNIKGFYRHLKVLTPLAYESFNLTKYDTIISISAGPAKGIIPTLNQKHIAMVMTPPRSLWDGEFNVRASRLKSIYKPISKILNNYMRMWDIAASRRVDHWTANSNYIAKKINKRYRSKATTIYPGIDDHCFGKVSAQDRTQMRLKYSVHGEFFLVVSRLYDYKNIDMAIKAAIANDKQLVIIGEGPDIKYLKKVANKNPRIKFIGFMEEDKDVRAFYNMAQALLFCGIEDFGLVPIEAMAQGTPVIGYKEGGLLETVIDGKTGEFFNDQEELNNILKDFDKSRYNPNTIVKNAERFTEEKFLEELELFLREVYER